MSKTFAVKNYQSLYFSFLSEIDYWGKNVRSLLTDQAIKETWEQLALLDFLDQ